MTYLECQISPTIAQIKNKFWAQVDLDKDQKVQQEKNKDILIILQQSLRRNKIFTVIFTQLFKLKF